MDCNLPDSPLHVIVQARILEHIAIFFFRWSSRPREQTHVPCLAGGFFTAELQGKPNLRAALRENQLPSSCTWMLSDPLLKGCQFECLGLTGLDPQPLRGLLTIWPLAFLFMKISYNFIAEVISHHFCHNPLKSHFRELSECCADLNEH